MNEYVNVLKKYAVFSGRARRREYWMFALVHTIIGFVLTVPFYVIGIPQAANATASDASAFPLGAMLSLIPAILYGLATFIPTLAVTVRRLHDTGRSGWWYLIALIPYLGPLILLIFTVLDSQPGSNAYGPSPKGNVVGSLA